MTPPLDPETEARIKALEVTVNAHEDRLARGGESIRKMEESLAANTATTAEIKADTSEMVDMFRSAKGAFKVLNWLGNLAKPVGALIAMCVAIWTAWLAFAGGSHPR